MCQPRNPQPPTTRTVPRVIVGRFSDILWRIFRVEVGYGDEVERGY